MRNLVLFIIRLHSFFLFLLLEAFCLYFIVQNNRYHRSFYLNSANAFTGAVYQSLGNLRSYLHLREENKNLLEENGELRTALTNMSAESHDLAYWMKDASGGLFYHLIAARIVYNSTHRLNNYFLLDKGRADGIRGRMGVISPDGVVGMIKDVSEHFSSAVSLLHKEMAVSARVTENNYTGVVTWDGEKPGTALLRDIPWHVRIEKGYHVATSGYSSVFPEGIPVGVISGYEKEPGSGFYRIRITLAPNLSTLRYVYVVDYLLQQEREGLETMSGK